MMRPSAPPSDAIGSATTLSQLLRGVAAAYGDDPAVSLERKTLPNETIGFAELERRSASLARGLLARGVGKGSRIGFICGNGPFFVVVLAAITRIGAVAIPVSTLARAAELVRVLRQSDVAGLIVQRSLLGYDYIERLCAALPSLRDAKPGMLRLPETPYLRWVVTDGTDLPEGVHDMAWLDQIADTVSEALLIEIESEVHATDQAIEIYTSGSMALPKGVRHDHGPLVFRALYISAMMRPERGSNRIVPLPMFWVGGMMMALFPNLVAGAISICTEGTPTSSLTAMGSVLNAEEMEQLALARPFWALGMSETLGPYSYGDVLRIPGRPLCAPLDHIADRYEIRVADEDGVPVPEGATGEIQVRGYAVTPGLHKIERAICFTADGYYRTGDTGLRDGSRIQFVGRDGDMIKSAGSNVSPAEVELEMQQLEGVHSAYVVGIPDAERGQLVVAALVPRQGAALDFKAIEDALRMRLSPFKVPRAYVALARDEVPMLFSNKVSRRQIERLVADRLGRYI